MQQVARYDPRSTHARNEIKCGDFCVSFFKQRIINRQERYSVQQVARYDLRPNHARNEIKRGDFFVSFFKQHIINRQERYSFRATSCTLRFATSCNKLHATGIILDINFVF